MIDSLTSSLVDIIVNTGEGANEIYTFLLENCEPSEDKGTVKFHVYVFVSPSH